jgi:hypothetical protein
MNAVFKQVNIYCSRRYDYQAEEYPWRNQTPEGVTSVMGLAA